jgi:hypothetical protein
MILGRVSFEVDMIAALYRLLAWILCKAMLITDPDFAGFVQVCERNEPSDRNEHKEELGLRERQAQCVWYSVGPRTERPTSGLVGQERFLRQSNWAV